MEKKKPPKTRFTVSVDEHEFELFENIQKKLTVLMDKNLSRSETIGYCIRFAKVYIESEFMDGYDKKAAELKHK